jgi:hypothetical protein
MSNLDRVLPWQRDPLRANVTHACPECPIGAPSTSCWCCGGHGSITDARLAEWQRIVNRTQAL